MPLPSNTKFSGTQRPQDQNSDFNAMNAAIRRILSMMGQEIPVKVVAVHGGGIAPTGEVDVMPAVMQQDGSGVTYPHGTIYGVPYIRIQGGAQAIICDPVAGDLGYIICSSRDISSVKANRDISAPGSFRQKDFADAVYFGGLLNAAPTEYIGFVDGNVVVQTAGQFIVNAASMQVNCAVTATGDVKAGNISLQEHLTTGVQAGGEISGPPEA